MVGGDGLPWWLWLENFVCQNERIWTLGGHYQAHPLDPPMNMLTNLICVTVKCWAIGNQHPSVTVIHHFLFSLSLCNMKDLYSTGKTSTWCKSAKSLPSFLLFGEKPSPHCVTWCNFPKPYFTHHWTSHWGPGRKATPTWPKKEAILWLNICISCNFQQLWFSWQKNSHPNPPPPAAKEGKNYETESIHFMQFPATLVQLAEKPLPPPPSGQRKKKFWDWIYPLHAISSNFGSAGRKAPPPPPSQRGKKFWGWIYPFHAISSNFGSAGRKAPPPMAKERKNSVTESIPFMQFPATLVQLAEKSPPVAKEGKFWHWIYPFCAISSNFGSAGRKAPPPAAKEGKFLRRNLSISCNFQQLQFSWQKSPPVAKERKNSETESIPFMQFPATLVQLAEKTPPTAKEGKILRLNLSISYYFQQLWFSCQKSPPPPFSWETWLPSYM